MVMVCPTELVSTSEKTSPSQFNIPVNHSTTNIATSLRQSRQMSKKKYLYNTTCLAEAVKIDICYYSSAQNRWSSYNDTVGVTATPT